MNFLRKMILIKLFMMMILNTVKGFLGIQGDLRENKEIKSLKKLKKQLIYQQKK